MSLIDKFRIIENHIKLENEEIIVSKIENYFDNYINTGFKILDINYINQELDTINNEYNQDENSSEETDSVS